MFDFGFSEMLIIGTIALVVLGPERLPMVARTAGEWIGKAQRFVAQVKSDIDRETELSELKRIQDEAKALADDVKSTVEKSAAEIEKDVQSAADDAKKAADDAGKALLFGAGPPELVPCAFELTLARVELERDVPQIDCLLLEFLEELLELAFVLLQYRR